MAKKVIGSVAAIVAVLALVVGVGIFGFGWFQPKALADQLAEQLTVSTSAPVSAEAQCPANIFVGNSLANVGGGDDKRSWADAVSTAFSESESSLQLQELMLEICSNPTLGDATAQALLSMDFGGNFDIAAANPWLVQFRDGWDASPGGGLNWLLVNEAGEYFVSPDYQDKAELVNQLLLQFSLMGETDRVSSSNWHIAGVVAGELPRAAANSVQEDLPALLLRFTFKGEAPDSDGDGWPDSGCLPGEYAIGFNLLDKRPEIFDGCPQAKENPLCPEGTPKAGQPVPDGANSNEWCETTPKNPPAPGTPPGVTPPPNPPTPPTPPEPPTPPTTVPKAPSQDPAQQGKAPAGGGKNANSSPGKLTKDPGKAPAQPRVNPAPPQPAETPRTIPVQPAEPKLNPAPAPTSPATSEPQGPTVNSGTIEQPEW